MEIFIMSIENNHSKSEERSHLVAFKEKSQSLKEGLLNHLHELREDYTLSEDDFIELKEIAKIELKELEAQIESISREIKKALNNKASK